MDADLQALADGEPSNTSLLVDLLRLQVCREEQRRLASIGNAAWSPYELAREEAITLYRMCFVKACDIRRQSMTTSTTKATEDDIISDIGRIATSLYGLAVAGTESVVALLGDPPL